ncbi:MAG: hypothetical protein R3F56_17205 [Planctomycetota bacterium]
MAIRCGDLGGRRHAPPRLVGAGLLAVAVSACREQGEAAPSPPDPWTIHGLLPGQPLAPHAARLGPPARTLDARRGGSELEWRRPSIVVAVDVNGLITTVWGDCLAAGPDVRLYPGLSEAEVRRLMGQGKLDRITRPRGSGVISIGHVELGRTLTYQRGGVRYVVGLRDDALTSVTATLAEPPR